MAAAKVKYGFKNAYYAKMTEATDGTISYATPVKLDGAVSMTLSPTGDDLEFYADDAIYFSESVNNGYDGSIELAMIPESFAKDILGETLDGDSVLLENASTVSSPFALLCEFTTDAGATKFVFYRCTAKRSNIEGQTKGESKEIKTESLDLMIRPRKDGNVRMKTTSTTTSTVLEGWYSEVHEPKANS